MGSLFSELILDLTSPDSSTKCMSNSCKLKFVSSNFGPIKNTLSLYLGEIPSGPIGTMDGNRVIGISSNYVDTMNSGLFIEVDFSIGTSDSEDPR